MLFKIGRKISTSGAISSIYEIYNPPIIVKIIFFIIGFSFNNKKNNENLTVGEKLRIALQGMGTTFIKLGQFLATRPDIIGENISRELEKLQDKLPPFDLILAKSILKKELGKESFDKITNISDPIAAASIAQVHFASLNINGQTKNVALKILRPNVEKIFNEELDALMFLAYIIESFVKKTKRLKLVEIVQLLREITNVEMDFRFEAAAASELYQNTKNDALFGTVNEIRDRNEQVRDREQYYESSLPSGKASNFREVLASGNPNPYNEIRAASQAPKPSSVENTQPTSERVYYERPEYKPEKDTFSNLYPDIRIPGSDNAANIDKDRLSDFYNEFLGRDTDKGGEQYWLGNLTQGIEDWGSVEANILRGDEFQNRQGVQGLFRDLFNRDATEEELDRYVGEGGVWGGGATDLDSARDLISSANTPSGPLTNPGPHGDWEWDEDGGLRHV